MGLRESMNNNPAAVTGGAVVILLLCLVLIYYFNFGGGRGGDAKFVYFDVANNQIKLVDVKAGQMMQTPLEGTTDVYMAQVLACGECGTLTDGMTLDQLKEQNMFVGWVWKTDPNATGADIEFGVSTQYRLLESERWIPGTSSAWYTLQDRQLSKCPGGVAANFCTAAAKK